MGEQDPRVQYRALPSAIDSDETVIEVETRQTAVETFGHPDPEVDDKPVRLIVW
ncbi:MAG: hypothetical protein QOD39_3643 [Mycobacterium sp.]|jgi:hypothetical protein|nr:hypothetical protein [Mycobacterium sp.]